MIHKLRAIWVLLFSSGHYLVVKDKYENLGSCQSPRFSFTDMCIIKNDLEETIGDIVQQEVAVHQTNKILNNE